MKINAIIVACAIVFSACSNETNNTEESTSQDETQTEVEPKLAWFGEKINADGAAPASEVLVQLNGVDSVRTRIKGTIEKVCQVKGCWMTMKVNDEQSMHVSFKDYGFFVPKDIDGKESIIEGYAYIETMTVDELKHYAEDEGKSQEEIDAITEPETKLSFVADGVVVEGYEIASAE